VANKRIFYAVQRAGISPINSNNFTVIRGLQTLGVTTTFNLEQVFEIGQLAIYENIEGVPDVEVSTEKVLDGYCPVYLLATQADDTGAATTASTLVGRSQAICKMAVAIYEETQQYAEGTPGAEVHMSGLYVSSVGYQVSVDGNATETCTLVGNNKVWVIGGDTGNFTGYDLTAATWLPATPWSGGDVDPKAITGSGGVNRREDVLFGSGTRVSLLPINIPGVENGGGCSGLNIQTNGVYGVHVQSWSVNTDLGREELFELGRKGTYYRYVNFPVEVTNEITVISISGDMISATEEGIYDSGVGGCGSRYNLTDQCIRLCMCEGLVVDSGSKNKLSSVGVSGGDAGGGNVEVTYSYSNFNDFDVMHSNDPNTGLRPEANGY
jgi:hypothetical protein